MTLHFTILDSGLEPPMATPAEGAPPQESSPPETGEHGYEEQEYRASSQAGSLVTAEMVKEDPARYAGATRRLLRELSDLEK
jgi:hypothetical protein